MAAKVILGKRPELVLFSITESYETVFHIAVLGESPELVDYLVSIMSKDDLEIPNINGATALHIAAITGNTEIATILIRENNNLLDIPDHDGKTPIDIAALCRKRDMVDLLYKESQQMTGEFWTNENGCLVLMKCVEANLFNVALQMVTKHPVLATNGSVLRLLAHKPHDFHVLNPGIISWLLNSFFRICPWKIQFPDKESDGDALQLLRFILKEIGKLPKDELVAILKGPPDETKEDEKKTPYEKETQEALHLLRTISENIAKMPARIYSLFENSANNKTPALNEGNRKYSSRVLFIAAEMGNTTFIVEVIRQYPHLVWELNDNSQTIFHVAVSYGHVGVYKLLNEMGSSSKKIILAMEDKDGNNMLHLVGEKAKGDRVNNVRGVGMQLNPDISWFKAIKKIFGQLTKPNVSDFIPSLAWLDLQGVAWDMKMELQRMDQIITMIINNRIESNSRRSKDAVQHEGKKDLSEVLLELNDQKTTTSPSMTQIKALIMILKNRHVMNRIQEELANTVGLNSMVVESHLPKLQYLNATIKETFRLHPVGALGLTGSPSQTCKIEFNSERFLTQEGTEKWDFQGNNMKFLPFGSWRRLCPGYPLAEKMQTYILASLFHSFNWTLPKGEEHDLSDIFLGISLKKRKPLIVIPSQRLSDVSLYM
ncbi:hypothetical protein CTI12_AA504940 [Artemisia annua]|uniref:Ankyrin repeat-containing protein n=1 Tax=Artemisia annua TaxID=35608 RepID=A0A2U1LC60_ARTAN|nr:hypothetical protein CTI12_AA504940 [Artemisia annua]